MILSKMDLAKNELTFSCCLDLDRAYDFGEQYSFSSSSPKDKSVVILIEYLQKRNLAILYIKLID